MRIRIEIWVSLRPKLQEEIQRTGLSANEIVNTLLADYFKSLPRKS